MANEKAMRLLPSAVTTLRLAAAPVFYFAALNAAYAVAAAVFALAAASDILDGFLARRLGVSSGPGAYYDATADFVFVIAAFAAFAKIGWYHWIVFIPISASFACFVLSSGLDRPVYDPVGKRMGAFLMASIALSLAFPHPILRRAVTVALISYCAVSLAFRLASTFKRARGPADR
jgi:phosphatidylglycerophosphate synthase